MKTKTVVVWGAVALALFYLQFKEELKNTIAGLTFSFVPAGFRLIGISEVEIDIKVRVANVGYTTLPLQGLNLTLERIRPDGTSYPFAATPPEGVSARPIQARAVTEFTVSVRSGTLQAITEIITSFQKRGMNRFRVTGTIQAAGLALNMEPVPFNL